MYEYLRALRDRFPPAERTEKLIQEVETHRQTLAYRLDKQGRKELLHLIDAQSALQDEVALYNFVAGFRLAKGIESELQSQEPYSYTREQEKYACEVLEREVEG